MPDLVSMVLMVWGIKLGPQTEIRFSETTPILEGQTGRQKVNITQAVTDTWQTY